MLDFPDDPPQPSTAHNESVPSYCRNDEGDIFLAAESWKPDACTSCVCMDSAISCYSESCPSVACERPVLRKGQCCPYCLGKIKGGRKQPSSPPVTSQLTWAANCTDQLVYFFKLVFLVGMSHRPNVGTSIGERWGNCAPKIDARRINRCCLGT